MKTFKRFLKFFSLFRIFWKNVWIFQEFEKFWKNFSRARSSLWPTKIANIVRVRPLKFDFSETRREIQLLTRTGRYAQSRFAKIFRRKLQSFELKNFQFFLKNFAFFRIFWKIYNFSVTHCHAGCRLCYRCKTWLPAIIVGIRYREAQVGRAKC